MRKETCKKRAGGIRLTFMDVILPSWQASCKDRGIFILHSELTVTLHRLYYGNGFGTHSKVNCTRNFPISRKSEFTIDNGFEAFKYFCAGSEIWMRIDFPPAHSLYSTFSAPKRGSRVHTLARNVKNGANLTRRQDEPHDWHFDKDVFLACQGGKWTEYQMEHQKLTINSDKLLN